MDDESFLYGSYPRGEERTKRVLESTTVGTGTVERVEVLVSGLLGDVIG